MRETPKFNKKKCLKCMYHGINHLGYPTRIYGTTVRAYCNYATITGQLCTFRDGRKTEDRRGKDYNDCKLYHEGKPPRIEEGMEYMNFSKEAKGIDKP